MEFGTVEILKTSVVDHQQAAFLLQQLHHAFPNLTVNFDLEDCDHILRIQNEGEHIPPSQFIEFLHRFDCYAEELEDVVPA